MAEIASLKHFYLILAPAAYFSGVIASFEFGMHNYVAKKITAKSQEEFYQKVSENIEHYSSLNGVLFMNVLVAGGARGLSSQGLEDVADDVSLYLNFGIAAPFMYLGMYHGFKLNNKLYDKGILKVKKSKRLRKLYNYLRNIESIKKLKDSWDKSNQPVECEHLEDIIYEQ